MVKNNAFSNDCKEHCRVISTSIFELQRKWCLLKFSWQIVVLKMKFFEIGKHHFYSFLHFSWINLSMWKVSVGLFPLHTHACRRLYNYTLSLWACICNKWWRHSCGLDLSGKRLTKAKRGPSPHSTALLHHRLTQTRDPQSFQPISLYLMARQTWQDLGVNFKRTKYV